MDCTDYNRDRVSTATVGKENITTRLRELHISEDSERGYLRLRTTTGRPIRTMNKLFEIKTSWVLSNDQRSTWTIYSGAVCIRDPKEEFTLWTCAPTILVDYGLICEDTCRRWARTEREIACAVD